MIEVNNPVNVFYYVKSTSAPYDAELVILGTDRSINIRITSDTVAAGALSDLSGLDAIVLQEDPEDQGAIKTAPIEHFTASYISFDNDDDGFKTTMLLQRAGRNYAKVSMRSKVRADVLAAITAIDTQFV